MDAIRALAEGIAGVEDGVEGVVWRASGFYDPESCEYEAWMFQPNHEEGAYYVTREQWMAAG